MKRHAFGSDKFQSSGLANSHSGVTTIELVIFIAIIAVLVAVTFQAYDHFREVEAQLLRRQIFSDYLTNKSISFSEKYRLEKFSHDEFKRFPTQITTQSYYGGLSYLQPQNVDEILAMLPTAFSHFGVPESMNLDETKDVYFAIALQDQKALEDVYPDVPIAESAVIKITSSVTAKLSSSDFDITPLRPDEQAIGSSGVTIWAWKIKPNSGGVKSLSLFVSALIPVGPNDAPLGITTYEKIVNVEVGFLTKIVRTANEYSGLIGWITLIGALLAILKAKFFEKLRLLCKQNFNKIF